MKSQSNNLCRHDKLALQKNVEWARKELEKLLCPHETFTRHETYIQADGATGWAGGEDIYFVCDSCGWRKDNQKPFYTEEYYRKIIN